MTGNSKISRRQALTRSLILPLMVGVSAAGASSVTHAADSRAKVLVAYFTRTGNTRLIATQIARALDATLFQIVPAEPYPDDYEAQVAHRRVNANAVMSLHSVKRYATFSLTKPCSLDFRSGE